MNIREIITELNVIISNGVEKEKYLEIKEAIKKLLAYAELEEQYEIKDFDELKNILEDYDVNCMVVISMGLEIQKLRKELKNGRKNKDVAKGNA
jgi:hypothetical protein